MGIVVQKFGGTSLRDGPARLRVVDWVKRRLDDHGSPVVVVSAMGRSGDPYATDTLLSLLGTSDPGDLRARDLVASCGEVISAAVVASLLRGHGLKAQALSGGEAGIGTDDQFGDAKILTVDPSRLLALVSRGIIPVVAGFQGVTREGLVATLGRGGSDTTAVALAAALDADRVEIYTDVNGIKTADPRWVPDAKTIAQMDYDEVFQLANLGAKVIHPRAVELARQCEVPMVVRSTFEDLPGTEVGATRRVWDPWGHRQPERAVTGIAQLSGLVQFRFELPPIRMAPHMTLLFEALGEAGISVDLINLFPGEGYFCVPQASCAQTEGVMRQLDIPCRWEGDRAKVSVVGSAIQGLPGVVGRVLAALGEAGVPVLQSADSQSTISLLIHQSGVETALVALHQKFGLADS